MSIVKTNQITDLGGNELLTSNGSGVISSGGAITNTPSFFAYQSSAQSIGNATQTIVQYDTVLYDTNSSYSNSTYRFTPQTAGKYYVGMTVRYNNVNSSRCIGYLYKNNVLYAVDEQWSDSGSGPDLTAQNYAIIDMNGSSDYVDARTYHDKGFAVNTYPVYEAVNFFAYKIIGV